MFSFFFIVSSSVCLVTGLISSQNLTLGNCFGVSLHVMNTSQKFPRALAKTKKKHCRTHTVCESWPQNCYCVGGAMIPNGKVQVHFAASHFLVSTKLALSPGRRKPAHPNAKRSRSPATRETKMFSGPAQW